MNKIYCFILAIFFSSSSLFAVQVEGMKDSNPTKTSTSETVERGGIVTSINTTTGLLFVDGVPYTYSYAKVYLPGANERQGSTSELKTGMFIKFITIGSRIQDIWVVVKK